MEVPFRGFRGRKEEGRNGGNGKRVVEEAAKLKVSNG
jgi:hypothetical protein